MSKHCLGRPTLEKKTYSGKLSVTLLEIHNNYYHLFTNYKKRLEENSISEVKQMC